MSDMDDDIDDLVGATPRQRRAARDSTLDDLVRSRKTARGTGSPLVEDMIGGVTVSWLSQVFGMDPKTVKQKLADCPPLHRRKGGYVYHLAVAAQYLVKPAISPEQFLKTVKASDLPAAFQTSFWDAALKRQKWEENAGQLWRTARVRDVLGSTFQTIKFTTQLWADTLERRTGLSAEQRKLLIGMVDALQEDIYKALIKQAADQRTGPQAAEVDEMLGNAPAALDDDDDDGMDLV